MNVIDYYNRGNRYFELKSYSKAIENYSTAIRYDGAYFKAYYKRAMAYSKMGNEKEASYDFETAMTLSFENRLENIDADYKNGLHHHRNGNFNKAIQSFSMAINKTPNVAEYYYSRAESYYHGIGNLERGLYDYQRALTLIKPHSAMLREDILNKISMIRKKLGIDD